jgi:hypothetical protein
LAGVVYGKGKRGVRYSGSEHENGLIHLCMSGVRGEIENKKRGYCSD